MTMVDVAGSGEPAGRWMGLEPLGTSELGRSGAGRLPRRGAMGLGLAGLAAAALPGTVAGAPQAHVSVPVQGTGIDTLDERFKAIIPDPNVLIERVAGGFRFVEGPVWVDNSVLFVDNNLDTIFRYRDMVWGPEITLFRYPGGTNIDEQRPPGVGGPGPQRPGPGQAGAPAGHGARQPAHHPHRAGRAPDRAHHHLPGQALQQPQRHGRALGQHHLLHRPALRPGDADGGQGAGLPGHLPHRPGRADLPGGQGNRPNGLCLSPDETRLYVVDSVELQARVYDVQPDGSLRNERLFADVREWGPNGGPDGVKCDSEGNFYLTGMKEDNNPAGPGTVMVFDPDGDSPGADHPPRAPGQLRLRRGGLEDPLHDRPQRPLSCADGRARHPRALSGALSATRATHRRLAIGRSSPGGPAQSSAVRRSTTASQRAFISARSAGPYEVVLVEAQGAAPLRAARTRTWTIDGASHAGGCQVRRRCDQGRWTRISPLDAIGEGEARAGLQVGHPAEPDALPLGREQQGPQALL